MLPQSKVSVETGIPLWSESAVGLLEETASTYNSVLTLNEFAEEVQRRTGTWANVTSKTWVRKVLLAVTEQCTQEGWPYLASLVVRTSDGKPGPWYLDVMSEHPEGSASDVDHAAAQRLACYEHFGAIVPLDAVPTRDPLRMRRRIQHLDAPAPRTTTTRTRKKTKPRPHTKVSPAAEERRGAICPTCFMEMPLSGICANCS